MKNNEEGIQPIQPAVPTDNTEPAAPAEAPAVEPATEPTVINEEAAAEFASEETAVSDELLQELHELDSAPQTTAPKSDIVFTDAPKKSRVVTVLFVILLLGAIAAAGVFAYLYFTKPTTKTTSNTSSNSSSSDTTNSSSNTNTTDDTNTTTTDQTDTTSSFTKEGDAITDSTVTKELTDKVSTLMGILPDDDLSYTLQYSLKLNGTEDERRLFINGTVTECQRIQRLYYSLYLQGQERFLTDQEVDIIETEDNISLALMVYKPAIDGDVVANAYKDLFGEELEKQPLEGCIYSYNKSTDVYYNPTGGSGGVGSYWRYYNITDFTKKDDAAYVYMRVASADMETNEIFCDIAEDTPEDSNLEACATNTTAEGSPTANEIFNTAANFAYYRFVFNQADDGTYYFVEVEKL